MSTVFNKCLGIKCLILDEETTGIISLVYSQSDILKRDIYLIEKLSSASTQKMQHMKVIYLIRPSQENYNSLVNDLKQHRFSEYYLYFTNSVSNYFIEKLAEADESNLIKNLSEVYMDYYCIQKDLFTLNIPSTISLIKVGSPHYHILRTLPLGLPEKPKSWNV